MRAFLFLALLVVLSGCAAPTPQPTPSPSPTPTASPRQTACLQAAQTALQMEIDRYQKWLSNTTDPAKKQTYEQALHDLQTRLATYQHMAPADFHPEALWRYPTGFSGLPLPKQAPILLPNAWLGGPLPAMLHFPDQTRSGPFYIVVGVVEGLHLHPGVHYRLTLLPIMPQSYPFPSFYVCVLEATPLPALQ